MGGIFDSGRPRCWWDACKIGIRRHCRRYRVAFDKAAYGGTHAGFHSERHGGHRYPEEFRLRDKILFAKRCVAIPTWRRPCALRPRATAAVLLRHGKVEKVSARVRLLSWRNAIEWRFTVHPGARVPRISCRAGRADPCKRMDVLKIPEPRWRCLRKPLW